MLLIKIYNNMTFDTFIKTYLGKKVDYDNAYGGQCVDLFRQYLHDVLGLSQPKGVVGAADFWTNYSTDEVLYKNFDKIPNTPTGVPQKGDVMFWNKRAGGGFGHVSIFIEGDVTGFTSLDQNFPTLSLVTKTKHTYTNVLGWLHPKSLPITEQPMTDQDKKDIESMKNLRAFNGVWYESKHILADFQALKDSNSTLAKSLSGKDSAITTAQRERDEAQLEAKNSKETISRLETQLLISDNEKQGLMVGNKKLQEMNDKQGREMGGLKGDIQTLATANRELKKAATDSLSSSELLRLALLKFLRLG